MQSILLKSLVLVISITALTGFTGKAGGEGFEIYLDNRVLLQQFDSKMDDVKMLSFNHHLPGSILSVKYYHCGRAGKNRTLTIKDMQDKLLKEWRFADDGDAGAPMKCALKEIMDLKKTGAATVKLYYASSQLPRGRLLTLLQLRHSPAATP